MGFAVSYEQEPGVRAKCSYLECCTKNSSPIESEKNLLQELAITDNNAILIIGQVKTGRRLVGTGVFWVHFLRDAKQP